MPQLWRNNPDADYPRFERHGLQWMMVKSTIHYWSPGRGKWIKCSKASQTIIDEFEARANEEEARTL